MRTEKLTESQEKVLQLTGQEALALQKIRRRLASTKLWWGEPDVDKDDREERSVVSCLPVESDRWLVTVANAVGIISVGSLQIVIEPKIPTGHLLYLFQKSGRFPRLDDQRAAAAQAKNLWELVAHWYIEVCVVLLRHDLIRDYALIVDDLRMIRGRVSPALAAAAVYRGSLSFRCEFDEFSIDTPLNRTLKAAAEVVAASTLLELNIRQGAARLLARMSDVGPLVSSDQYASLDRRSAHYSDALILAKHILRGQGRVLADGEILAWTFLIPTPQMVEEGLRKTLVEQLGSRWKIDKRGKRVEGARITLNPDLLFSDGLAVGDVKYKLLSSNWNRSDLYEIISFATVFSCRHSSLIGFRTSVGPESPELTVGEVHVAPFSWMANLATSPEDSAIALSANIE